MRPTISIFLLLNAFILTAAPADTITYWVISYDQVTVVRGSLNTPLIPGHEVAVTGAVKDLTVSFVYDTGQPEVSTLVVKEKNEVLTTIEGDPDMGPVFTVPVRELIGTHQRDVRYELDFYYTDDRGQKNLKLGTIIFVFK